MNRTDRQERRLMRQRGTGTTDVQDVTFGFRFGSTPTSTRAGSSPRKAATPDHETENDVQSSEKRSARPNQRVASARKTPLAPLLETPEPNSSALGTPAGGQSITPGMGKRTRDVMEDELTLEITSNDSKARRLSSGARRVTASPINIASDDELGEGIADLPASRQGSMAGSALSARDSRSASANMEILDTPSAIARNQMRPVPTQSPEVMPVMEEDFTVLDTVEQPTVSLDTTEASNMFVTQPSPPAPESEPSMEDDLSLTRPDEDLARRQMPPPPKPTKRRNARDPSQPRKKKFTGKQIEIKVYRRTKDPNLDTSSQTSNVLPSVNSVDVLSQIVSEIGARHVESLKSKQTRGTTQLQRATRRRIGTVQAFLARLDDALFDMSNAQNAVYATQHRLARAKREQGGLRAELMRLKRERDDVAVDMDGVREAHARRARENDERNGMLGRLHDVDVAVQRGRLRAARDAREGAGGEGGVEEPLEDGNQLLEDVTRFVGSGGGFAGAVRRWNEFLEKSSDVLQAGAR